jgi:hypothetical protein
LGSNCTRGGECGHHERQAGQIGGSSHSLDFAAFGFLRGLPLLIRSVLSKRYARCKNRATQPSRGGGRRLRSRLRGPHEIAA